MAKGTLLGLLQWFTVFFFIFSILEYPFHSDHYYIASNLFDNFFFFKKILIFKNIYKIMACTITVHISDMYIITMHEKRVY